MKYMIGLLGLFLLLSCQKTKTSQDAGQDEREDGEKIGEMSIFQLPGKWYTQNGDHIELKDLKGFTLAVVMIYSSCQSACPRLISDMKNIEAQVSKSTTGPVKYVLVSIDPQTDTPEHMAAFAKERNMVGKQWLFLQGTLEDTRTFSNVLAVKYKKISPMDFSHSNIISIFDKMGVLRHQQEGLGVNNKETLAELIRLAG